MGGSGSDGSDGGGSSGDGGGSNGKLWGRVATTALAKMVTMAATCPWQRQALS